jgi:uncharacterized delta-60 repeat protein
MSRALRTTLIALAIAAPSVARAGYAPGCSVALEIPAAIAHEANALAIQPDGKIVVAGYANFGSGRDFLVARLHPDLSLDTSFNGTGYRVDDLQGLDDEGFGVVVQFDQKIVVGGYSQKSASQYWFAFARYHRDGSLDASFGTGGFTAIDFTGSQSDQARSLAIQPDGKILGAGFLTPAGVQRIAVVRLLKNGNLDASFDADGGAQPSITGSNFSAASDVLVQPDGKIVVSGESRSATGDFLALRLLPDGTLDNSFNATGWAATDVGGGTADSSSSLVLQADGKIVLAGTAGANAALVRHNPGGGLDATFGGTGRVVQDFSGSDAGNALTLDDAGNLLLAGASDLTASNFAFARFRPNGALDLSRIDDVSGLDDRGFGIAVTRAGKILLAGSGLGPANPRATLALYNPDGTQNCGSFFLHPTGTGAAGFVPVGSCATNDDCVNDQAGNAPTGTPATPDGLATLVRSNGSPAQDLYELGDGFLPPGKVVTEIEVVAQLAWGGAATAPSAELLYQRQGFDAVPMTGSPMSVPATAFQEFRQRFSALNWPAAELDALEIGLAHTAGNDLLTTRNYVRVTYGETLVHPVDIFTAGSSGDSTNGKVTLNWLNPSYGLYDRTVIRRDTACPATPADGVPVASVSDGLGAPGGFVDTVPIGPTYFYAAFVLDSEGRASTGVCRSATPFDRNAGRVEWRYDTSIAALATPGLRVNVPGNESVVYSVANDGLVHAIRGGLAASGGGSWPSGYRPFSTWSAAQARPPVVPLPPGSRLAVLLGSQDGHAYAIDALTGALMWKSARLSTTIQAAPSVVLSAYGGGADLVFVATRNTGQPNRLYALDPTDGTVVWYFDNGGDPTGIGMIVSGASVDYVQRHLYFTSAQGTSGNTTWCLEYLATPPARCWASFGVDPTGGSDVEASPILFQGSVFVSESSASGNLYAVNPLDGTDSMVSSLLDGGAKGFVFPQFGTTNVFASTSTRTLSVNGVSGLSNWAGSCVATPSTPTAVPGTDWVFVGSNQGKLFQFSASGGAGCPAPPSACIGDCSSTIVGAPAFDVLKSLLYAGTDEGKIYAVRPPF